MSYELTNDEALRNVINILDEFDIEGIKELIHNQMYGDPPSMYYTNDTNQFYPFFVLYKQHRLDPDLSEENIEALDNQFYKICDLIQTLIADRYNLDINKEWMGDNLEDVPAITSGMYDFFIIDFATNLEDAITRYIVKNAELVYENFSQFSTGAQIELFINEKNLSREMATIIHCIYDICAWVISSIVDEEFFDLMEENYIPFMIVKRLYDDGNIGGEFMENIRQMYHESVDLRSTIGFNIMGKMISGEIADIFKDKE